MKVVSTIFLVGLSLQSTLVTTAQEVMPKLRGTAMSLASFNMFVGGGIGTFINGKILNSFGISKIFIVAGTVMFIIALISTIVVQKAYKFSMKLSN